MLSFVFVALSMAALNSKDSTAIKSFCTTTNIASVLASWCTATSVCTWQGVTCDATGSFVDTLVLSDSAITGTFPAAFTLTSPTDVSLSNLEVTGALSAQFFTDVGPTLLQLHLISLQLTFRGSFLSKLSHIRQLQIIDVPVTNTLNFFLATENPHITSLVITYTSLGGPLLNFFDGAAQLPLTQIDLSHNKFTGQLDSGVCDIPNLERLDLSNNELTGFPACLAHDSSLGFCDLSSNFLCEPSNEDFGVCAHDTDVNAVVDICGECGGNSQECLDCFGVKNGDATYDVCDVCNGDGTSCLDCFGVPQGSAIYDACDVCGGPFVGACVDCEGVPHGTTVYDNCDVCGGDNSECVDCAGVLGGGATYNQCGICTNDADDNTDCRDCRGVLFGTAVYDECGVCGGHNRSCSDCAGVIHGHARRDRCGVCRGDGRSCGISGLEEKEESLSTAVTIMLVIALLLCIIFGSWFWWCVVFRSSTRGVGVVQRRPSTRGTVVI